MPEYPILQKHGRICKVIDVAVSRLMGINSKSVKQITLPSREE